MEIIVGLGFIGFIVFVGYIKFRKAMEEKIVVNKNFIKKIY
ncbi:MAG: hypothetical protein OQJ93_05910 [Ignavibacteriaceae bacterium]|jgi:hypothetical protein|nr:hypothetical protein [Ignavibacteriaceae bacterium]MCW9096906.1 hypothetical protein [Ignavibacteriaceae bacterium]